MSIFAEIRASCATVAKELRWVRINEQATIEYANRLVANQNQLTHSEAEHLLGRGDETLSFFVLLDTINFGSGYFPYLHKESGASGYFTVARRLKEWIAECGVPSAEALQEMNGSKCAEIFGQTSTNPHAAELMILFGVAWSHLGHWALSRHGGDLLGFLKTAGTAEQAIRSLLEMPFYRDRAMHLGKPVAFLKRAQILLQDLKLAVPDHPLLALPDFGELTFFADNVLPYVLRAEGLIQCHPWLAERIEAEELLGSGSTEEVELRVCAVHIGELLSGTARARGVAVTSRELDFMLWQRGQELKKVSPLKRHRTRCVYY